MEIAQKGPKSHRARRLCYGTKMPVEETKVVAATSASARIIAAGIVIGFCYFASSILITVILAVLMAYFLDPVVTWMERWRIPRALGSLAVVLVSLALLALLIWTLVDRADQFGQDWPKYREPLRVASAAVQKRLESLEAHVSEITPTDGQSQRFVEVTDTHPVRNAVISRLGSLEMLLISATFVPFLLFFMLAGKRQVWHATMQLFPADQRTQVKE